ncbi:EYA4 [Lepeophtheirus salmonis]|uniref:EYA4 n=1 Tax=Lepeophtheirus salmonis TaxID=72036 RepID=A0A0K2UF77_LEPSM|nr:uncharacterized protein LOC121114178 [Lepeophtheirus salmonis]CAB4062358.1 EYA4 [Lepeophtheirus salmonis]CAF2901489.1 EYA4 [Lepeophtheirus salmonis]
MNPLIHIILLVVLSCTLQYGSTVPLDIQETSSSYQTKDDEPIQITNAKQEFKVLFKNVESNSEIPSIQPDAPSVIPYYTFPVVDPTGFSPRSAHYRPVHYRVYTYAGAHPSPFAYTIHNHENAIVTAALQNE